MPSITTLVDDIGAMLDSGEPTLGIAEFDAAATDAAVATGKALAKAATRIENEPKPRWGSLWASEVGAPCVRKLYYKVSGTKPDEATAKKPRARFMLGDIVEAAVVFLARAAGHDVSAQQERVEGRFGDWTVSGKRDAIIDNVSVDVKSASGFSFMKYAREGLTPENDTFGYRDQSEFYRHYGEQPTGDGSAILFADKSSMELRLEGVVIPKDAFDASVTRKVEMLEAAEAISRPPARIYAPSDPAVDSKVGRINVVAQHSACGLCEFRETCMGGAATDTVKVGYKTVTFFKKPPEGGY